VPVQKHKRRSRTLKKFRLHALRIHPFCKWCQRPLTTSSATTDHLIPLSRGGSNAWENLCLACSDCNQKRKNCLPSELPADPAWCGLQGPAIDAQPLWVAWTRYPGGRWRFTFQGKHPQELRKGAEKIVGKAGVTVVLPEGEEPGDDWQSIDSFASAVNHPRID
jgi:hypothetical protein